MRDVRVTVYRHELESTGLAFVTVEREQVPRAPEWPAAYAGAWLTRWLDTTNPGYGYYSVVVHMSAGPNGTLDWFAGAGRDWEHLG